MRVLRRIIHSHPLLAWHRDHQHHLDRPRGLCHSASQTPHSMETFVLTPSLACGHPSPQGRGHSTVLRKRNSQTYWEGAHGTASVPLPLLVPPAFLHPYFSPGPRIPALLPSLCRKHCRTQPQTHGKINVLEAKYGQWVHKGMSHSRLRV